MRSGERSLTKIFENLLRAFIRINATAIDPPNLLVSESQIGFKPLLNQTLWQFAQRK